MILIRPKHCVLIDRRIQSFSQWSVFVSVAVKILSADGVVSFRVTVSWSMWLVIPEEHKRRDIFCCHEPITCNMKCHGKFCHLCQSFFSDSRCPSTVETHSLLVFPLCWLLSVSTKLFELAAGTGLMIFWVLWPPVPREAWWHSLEWAEATGVSNFWLVLTCHTSALLWLTSEYSQCPSWKTSATLSSMLELP